jgi:hypothetical protein
VRDPDACRTCGGATAEIGRQLVLGRHDVGYRQCRACGFAQTQDPWWLAEAYSEAITGTDLGLLGRCRTMSARIPPLLACAGVAREPVLDWGGGYGTLTRMLRDAGVDCRHHDPHCGNVHARGFEASLEDRERWGAVIAVEVLEHLVDPWEFFRPAAARTDLIIATTGIVHEPAQPLGKWWYWAPEHGQHVSFHSRRSLALVASRLGMRHLRSGGLHVFVRGAGPLRRLAIRCAPAWRRVQAMAPRRSLLQDDYARAVRHARRGT